MEVVMRKKKNYSVFNNFNKNFHYMKSPNYFDEYLNEFSKDLYKNLYRGVAAVRKQDAGEHDESNEERRDESAYD